MKRMLLAVIAVTLSVIFLLSGCSFELRSIESLMRPPYTATESELEKSISKLLGNQISYRSPKSGEHHSAITIRDLNADGTKEAVVFYVNNNDDSVIRMCVLSDKDGKWILVSDFAGNGSGVLNLDFVDLNSDSDEEIIVSWSLFDDKSQKMLSVYTPAVNDGVLSVSACVSEPYDLMMVADVFGDTTKQLLVAHSSVAKDTAEKTTLRLIGINKDNSVALISENRLDSRITKLSSILYDIPTANATPRFFIDADISDTQRITHVLKWDKESKKFVSLLNDSEDPDITLRSSNLSIRDVNSDWLIDIPLRKPMSESKDSDTSFGYILEWCKVENNQLEPIEYYVVNLLENYNLFFPREWKNKVFVNSDTSSRTWNFVDSQNTKLFSITAFAFEDWDENSSNVTEMLLMQNDTVYCCTITPAGEDFGIKVVDLLKYFSLNV